VVYKIPNSAEVEAPDFVHSEIRKSDQLTEYVKEKLGSEVSFGEMSLLLVNDTIVYVRPVYVQAASATAVPELSRVIAVNGDRIEMGNTLAEAMARITDESNGPSATPGLPSAGESPDTSGSSPSTGTTPSVPSPDVPDPESDYDPSGRSVLELISDAEDFLEAADGAEAQGLPEEAAGLRDRAAQALAAVQDLLGGGGAASAGATPTQSPGT
jgi:uncharacterized membrane protein (UPF0182 family)